MQISLSVKLDSLVSIAALMLLGGTGVLLETSGISSAAAAAMGLLLGRALTDPRERRI